MNNKVKKMVALAMLSAMAYVMVFLSKLIPFQIMFLHYDAKDVIITLGGLIYGPVAALIISVLVSFIEMITISGTGVWGFLMNVLSTCAFAIPVALIYRKKKNLPSACIGLVVGVIAMTVTMLIWNYIISPIYMGAPREQVAAMLVPVFLPFNLLKAGINAALTYILYKPVITALRKAGFVTTAAPNKENKKTAAPIILMIAAGLILITGVLIFIFI